MVFSGFYIVSKIEFGKWLLVVFHPTLGGFDP